MADEDGSSRFVGPFVETYQRYALSPARAEQLAQEVKVLNDGVLDLLPQLRLEDDPAGFLSALEAGKQKSLKGGR